MWYDHLPSMILNAGLHLMIISKIRIFLWRYVRLNWLFQKRRCHRQRHRIIQINFSRYMLCILIPEWKYSIKYCLLLRFDEVVAVFISSNFANCRLLVYTASCFCMHLARYISRNTTEGSGVDVCAYCIVVFSATRVGFYNQTAA